MLKFLKRMIAIPPSLDSYDNQQLAWKSYAEAGLVLKSLNLGVDLSGRCLLDVGCGLGGKSVYYAEQSARLVVGVDINKARARVAAAFARHHRAGAADKNHPKVQIVIADAARLPFAGGVFDIIISTDTWEHLLAPIMALQECARVVQPGGSVALSALPYYSPWGAHIWDWLPLPWVQVILPKPLLFRIMRWIERVRRVNAQRPSATRLDWARLNDPAHAQQLTVASLEHGIALANLEVRRFEAFPIGRQWGVIARLIAVLGRFPLLREVLTGMVVVVMRKPASD